MLSEEPRELVDVLGHDGETGGRTMTAEAREHLRAGGQRVVEIESWDRASRTGPSSSAPAMSTTGRWKRSTSREATIPITPRCQSAPART